MTGSIAAGVSPFQTKSKWAGKTAGRIQNRGGDGSSPSFPNMAALPDKQLLRCKLHERGSNIGGGRQTAAT